MKFTLDTIRSLSPVSPKTDIIVFDDDLPGFGVRARLSGSKVFIVQNTIGDKQRRISIGNPEDICSHCVLLSLICKSSAILLS
jgi:hypothetical protein